MPRKGKGSSVLGREAIGDAIRSSGMLEPSEPLELTYRDLGRTQVILRHMLAATIDAMAENDGEADAMLVSSEMSRHVFALSRVLHAMASGQQADQLIRPRGRRYEHPARREVIGICAEALEAFQRKGGLSKTAASETIADVIKQIATRLNLDQWHVSPRTIREDWPAKAFGDESANTRRFDVFLSPDSDPTPEQLVTLLLGLLAGPMWVLAEHQEFNPPPDK